MFTAKAASTSSRSQIIRRILVDHARSRGYDKRGGNAEHVPLDDVLLGAEARGVHVLALDDALEALSVIDDRKSRVVELRYFGGLSVDETAEVLGISAETAKRDWGMAKTWLFDALTSKNGSATSYELLRRCLIGNALIDVRFGTKIVISLLTAGLMYAAALGKTSRRMADFATDPRLYK